MAGMVDKAEFLEEDKFDAIVVGTGITESVAAAALARTGKRVLHLDALPFYGGAHATHPLPAFREWLGTLSSDGSGSEEGLEQHPANRAWNRAAEVEELPVNHAKLVVQGLKVERDAMNRPVIEDGISRGSWPTSECLQFLTSPACFVEVSHLDKMDPTAEPKDDETYAEQHAGTSQDPEKAGGNSDPGQATDPENMDGKEAASQDAEDTGRKPFEGWEEIAKNGRDYNIDFAPKLNLSSGSLVQALLQSGVGRYLEFMPLQKTFTFVPNKDGMGNLEKVPMSKGEIFQSRALSPMEKRLLMKFLQQCVTSTGIAEAKQGGWAIEGIGGSEQEQLGFKKAVGHVEGGLGHDSKTAASGTGWETNFLENQSLDGLLKEAKLSSKAADFIAHGIAMMSPSSSALAAVRRVQLYAKSIGRYSDSAFLACYYGTAEVPQGFCRMCAVYGGLYVLRRTPAYLLYGQEDGKCQGIICNKGQRLTAPLVICSSSYLPSSALPSVGQSLVRRCVCITSGQLPNTDGISLALIPPGSCGNSTCIRVLQMDWTAQACPRGKYVWYLWSETPGDCDLKAAVELLRRMAPSVGVHWCAFYSQSVWTQGESGQQTTDPQELKPGFWVVPPPSTDVDSGDAIQAGEKLFRSVCGEAAEFLEAMPEPEVVDEMFEEPVGVDLTAPLAGSGSEAWNEDQTAEATTRPCAEASISETADT